MHRTTTISLLAYETFLKEWEGVPYRDCGMSKQGVDCLRFVVLVLDWLHGWDSTQMPLPPLLPRQTSLHSEMLVQDVVRFVRNRYPHSLLHPDSSYIIHPGDVVVCRNEVHEGHALVGGSRPNEAWHSLSNVGGGVSKTSLAWCRTIGISCIFRPTESLLC
jgi:hypothetical protein